MAINLSDLFTKIGKGLYAGKRLLTAANTTLDTDLQAYINQYDSEPINVMGAITNLPASMVSAQSSAQGFMTSAIKSSIQSLLTARVKADLGYSFGTVTDNWKEVGRQLRAASETLDKSTVGLTWTAAGANTGNGKIAGVVKYATGDPAEFALAESLIVTATSSSKFSIVGENAVNSTVAAEWPGGSGASTTITSYTASNAANKLTNGTFEEQDSLVTHVPEGWIKITGIAGTDFALSSIEVQTIVIAGTPTSGTYRITWTNAASDVLTSDPIAYNASNSDVAAAITSIAGLSTCTVVTTGTTPNFTHTVTFTGVPNPSQLTSVSALDTGTITHATTTAGSADTIRGARVFSFIGDGSTLTQLLTPVSLSASTVYCVALFAKLSAAATGILTIDLVDGEGGTVLTDAAATSNSFTVNAASMTTSMALYTGTFITPAVLPSTVYFRLRLTTALQSGRTIYFDEIMMVPASRLYIGGPYVAAFSGSVDWIVGDRGTIDITNDRAGELHEWIDRLFNLRAAGVYLPTQSSGTYGDALIA